MLAGISYDVLRETVRDMPNQQQFRRDLYGSRSVPADAPLERLDRLNDLEVTLMVDPAEVPFEVEAGLGNVGLRQDIFRPVVEALAEKDGAPKRIGDLAEQPSFAALPPGALVEALTVLTGAGRANWWMPTRSRSPGRVARA